MTNVIIYSTPTCVYCKLAKEYFKQNNVPFTEKDVYMDEAARNEMIEKSGQLAVPVIDINGKIVVGFDRGAISSMISKAPANRAPAPQAPAAKAPIAKAPPASAHGSQAIPQ